VWESVWESVWAVGVRVGMGGDGSVAPEAEWTLCERVPDVQVYILISQPRQGRQHQQLDLRLIGLICLFSRPGPCAHKLPLDQASRDGISDIEAQRTPPPGTQLTPSYEAMLRMFKERRRRAGEPLIETPHNHGLIDEAEAEMHTLSWPELMAAGGVAGVVTWVVSVHVQLQSQLTSRPHSPLTYSRRACRARRCGRSRGGAASSPPACGLWHGTASAQRGGGSWLLDCGRRLCGE
jgi:hypothetical protein